MVLVYIRFLLKKFYNGVFVFQIPVSSDGKAYWFYMDPSITKELMNSMITEYLEVYEKFPTRLRKIKCLVSFCDVTRLSCINEVEISFL